MESEEEYVVTDVMTGYGRVKIYVGNMTFYSPHFLLSSFTALRFRHVNQAVMYLTSTTTTVKSYHHIFSPSISPNHHTSYAYSSPLCIMPSTKPYINFHNASKRTPNYNSNTKP